MRSHSYLRRLTGDDIRMVAYCPSEFDPHGGLLPTAASILQDLNVIRPYFDGLITYGVKDDPDGIIPSVARKLDFQAMILGIWEPHSQDEIQLAIEQAARYSDITAGICVGNEGLYFERYCWEDLEKAFAQISHALPDLPLTTTEPWRKYMEVPRLLQFEGIHFHFPTIHAYWEALPNKSDPRLCAIWTANQAKHLQSLSYSKKPLIVKESGWPSAGDSSCSLEFQASFWLALQDLMMLEDHIGLAFFEAFDARQWKANEIGSSVESHWGLWTQARRPKRIVTRLSQL